MEAPAPSKVAPDKKKMNPSIPRKFAIALVFVALGFYVLVFSIGQMQDGDGKIPAIMLALCSYLIGQFAWRVWMARRLTKRLFTGKPHKF